MENIELKLLICTE